MTGVGQACGSRVVGVGVWAVAFSGLAVAVGAFIEIDGAGRGENGRRRLDGVLAKLRGFRNRPGAVLIKSDNDHGANKGDESGENEFAELECAGRVGGGGQGGIFAYEAGRQKKEKTLYREQRDTQDAEKRREKTEGYAGVIGRGR